MKTSIQLLLITAMVATLASVSSADKVEPQIGLIAQVELVPSSGTPDEMKATAKVTAPGSEEVLAMPTIRLLRGHQGETWSETPNGDIIHFLVNLEEQGKVTFLVELARGPHGESIISSQKTTIHINF